MNQNSMAIVILCSHLCMGDNVKPFEPAEWSRFADRLMDAGIQPYELMSFSSDDFQSKLNLTLEETLRISHLMDRSGSITFEIERYANIGINIMTRADNCYPKALKTKLGKSCPPIFYYAGNPGLVDKKCVGFVGSRSVGLNDESFTVATVRKVNANGYSVVSGGAKGIDSTSSAISVANGSFCVEYIADSLIRRIKSKPVVSAVLDNKLLILSVVKPDSGFSAGIAMMRNRFIYAQSEGTIIVKSDYNKGGTWSGASNNLKQRLCTTFCWNNAEYKGNIELIKLGAVPIDETWDGDVSSYEAAQSEPLEQISLFG